MRRRPLPGRLSGWRRSTRSRDDIPTQVAAEFVRLVLGLHGIAYRSAQAGTWNPLAVFGGRTLATQERKIVLLGSAAIEMTEPDAPADARLKFVADSQRMLNVTKVDLSYETDFWAHPEPAQDQDQEQDQNQDQD